MDVGYDGRPLAIGARIELHPSTDLWAAGARYGTVVDTWTGTVVGCRSTPRDRFVIVLDRIPGRRFTAPADYLRAADNA